MLILTGPNIAVRLATWSKRFIDPGLRYPNVRTWVTADFLPCPTRADEDKRRTAQSQSGVLQPISEGRLSGRIIDGNLVPEKCSQSMEKNSIRKQTAFGSDGLLHLFEKRVGEPLAFSTASVIKYQLHRPPARNY